MPDIWNRTPLGRNHVLIGAATLAAVIIIGIVGTIATGGDDEEDSDTSPLFAAPRAGRVVENAAIGARIRKPRRWSHERRGRSIVLRSPDRSILMSISLPPGTDRSAVVLRSAVAEIRRQYSGVRVVGTDTRRVGKLPTTSVVTSATNQRGVSLRILSSAPQGHRRAWLVQIFSAASAREKRLAEAQVAIGTLRLRG